jgi:predicted amidophosphoribosyltransferase
MPYWTKEKPCETKPPPVERVYSRDYYKYNRDKILLKYKLAKQTLIVDEVKKWKEQKLNDPNAFNPFREI